MKKVSNQILNILKALGFSPIESKVYVYIAKLGPLSNDEVASRLGISFEQLDPILKRLLERGVIASKIENKFAYSALEFNCLLNFFIEEKFNQAEELTKNYAELISIWKNFTSDK